MTNRCEKHPWDWSLGECHQCEADEWLAEHIARERRRAFYAVKVSHPEFFRRPRRRDAAEVVEPVEMGHIDEIDWGV